MSLVYIARIWMLMLLFLVIENVCASEFAFSGLPVSTNVAGVEIRTSFKIEGTNSFLKCNVANRGKGEFGFRRTVGIEVTVKDRMERKVATVMSSARIYADSRDIEDILNYRPDDSHLDANWWVGLGPNTGFTWEFDYAKYLSTLPDGDYRVFVELNLKDVDAKTTNRLSHSFEMRVSNSDKAEKQTSSSGDFRGQPSATPNGGGAAKKKTKPPTIRHR